MGAYEDDIESAQTNETGSGSLVLLYWFIRHPHYKLNITYVDTVQSPFCRAFIFLRGGILTAKLGGFS